MHVGVFAMHQKIDTGMQQRRAGERQAKRPDWRNISAPHHQAQGHQPAPHQKRVANGIGRLPTGLPIHLPEDHLIRYARQLQAGHNRQHRDVRQKAANCSCNGSARHLAPKQQSAHQNMALGVYAIAPVTVTSIQRGRLSVDPGKNS